MSLRKISDKFEGKSRDHRILDEFFEKIISSDVLVNEAKLGKNKYESFVFTVWSRDQIDRYGDWTRVDESLGASCKITVAFGDCGPRAKDLSDRERAKRVGQFDIYLAFKW